MQTKLILSQDVENLGYKGDVISVKAGFARNYLIPKGFATRWTEKAEAATEKIRELRQQKLKTELEKAKELAEKLASITISITKKTTKSGSLYGAISKKSISDALKSGSNISVDEDKIVIDTPIKNVGDHTVRFELAPEVTQDVKVSVVKDAEGEEQEKQE